MNNEITFVFPSKDHADDFASWWCDGGGESAYFEAYHEYDDSEVENIKRFDFSQCFPAWGYDPKKHGSTRKIVAQE